MNLKNSPSHFGLISIVLHWLMALGILFMFGLGLYMVELSYYDAWYRGSLDLHKSIGLTLVLILGLRLSWKWLNTHPKPLPAKPWEHKAALVTHILLYVFMAALMLSGYLISTADGRAIAVFELFSLPALPWNIDNQEDIAGEIHEILAWTLISFIAIHALAALKHHFIDRDRTLLRMLKTK